jgi:glycosyltransferase involved in cell wall biosynthesis
MAHGRLRFTFTAVRYGDQVLGGGEKHARDVAERLAARGHDVRVLTTCAESYQTWANVYPEGSSELRGVTVVRHRSRIPRLFPLDEVARYASTHLRRSRTLARAWLLAQGPIVPDLTARLAREAPDRDLVVIFAILSRLSLEGLRVAGHRAVVVPFVHEEPPIYTRLAREALSLPRALLVSTEEEWARALRVGGPGTATGAIVAVGQDPAPPRDPGFARPTPGPYLLVLGRLAKSRPILAVWREIVRRSAELPPLETADGPVPWSEVKLVTVGELSPHYERLPNVVPLDFVDDATRWQLLWHAAAVANPSLYESLSLVLLEAWLCRKPVVVNARCDVTAGQSRRSGGGVAVDFDDPVRAALELTRSLAGASARDAMGELGHAYVRERYSWDRVLDAYEAAARAIGGGGDLRAALAPWAPPGPAC